MSAIPFQSNPAHARNIRRALTERRAAAQRNNSDHLSVQQFDGALHHARSSDARLFNDQVLHMDGGTLGVNHHHLTASQEQKSKSDSNVSYTNIGKTNESLIGGLARPEAWKLAFSEAAGTGGGFKLGSTIGLGANGLRQSIVDALQCFGGDVNKTV